MFILLQYNVSNTGVVKYSRKLLEKVKSYLKIYHKGCQVLIDPDIQNKKYLISNMNFYYDILT